MANKIECLLETGLAETEVDAYYPDGTPTGTDAAAEVKDLRKKATRAQQKAKIDQDVGLKIDTHLKDYVAKGGTDEAAVRSLIARDRFERSEFIGSEQRKETILGKAHSFLAEAFDQFRPTKFGFKHDTEGVKNMALEIHGKNTGDAQAATYAKAWNKATEYLRERYNRAGGSINKNEKWGTPQSHNANKIRGVDADSWVEYVMGRLDRDKMLDFKTQKPMDDAELDELLTNMYNKIVSGGHTKRAESLADKHGRQRILHFKNADGWLEYQNKFGGDNIWAGMTDHLDIMSRDISLMETLGTDPDAVMERLLAENMRKIETSDLGSTARNKRKLFVTNTKAGYDLQRQNHDGLNPGLNNVFGLPRNIATAMILPASAPLSALTDSAYMAITKRYLGLPATKQFFSYVKQMAGQVKAGNKEARMALTKMGFSAEYALDRTMTAMRYADAAAEAGSKIAERAMRASLLTPHTIASRQAFQMDFLSSLNDMSATSYGNLNPNLKKAFDRYGINEADWDAARKSEPYRMDSNPNAKYMNPANMAEEQQVKFGGMIEAETHLAVPTPDSMSRAGAALGTEAGTFGGEFVRTVMQFKSFPVTIMMSQWSRVAYGNALEGVGSRSAYMASAVGLTTVLGLGIVQIKDILKGKEPSEFTGDPEKDGRLLWKAMNQGGSLGLVGDAITNSIGFYGRPDAVKLFSPPSVDLIANDLIGDLLFGNAKKAITGEDTSVTKDAINIASKTPGLNMWYAKLALDRMLWDQANDAASRDWARNERRKQRKLKKDTGQDYWWKPGNITPE